MYLCQKFSSKITRFKNIEEVDKRYWRKKIKDLKCFLFWILVRVSSGFIFRTSGFIASVWRVYQIIKECFAFWRWAC